MGSVHLEVMANIYLGSILFFPWASWSAGCSTEVHRSNCVYWCSVYRLQKQALNMLDCCKQGFRFSHMCHLRTLKNYVHFIQADSPCISIKYCIIYSCVFDISGLHIFCWILNAGVFVNPHLKGLGHTITEYENKSKIWWCFALVLSSPSICVLACLWYSQNFWNGSTQCKFLHVFWGKKKRKRKGKMQLRLRKSNPGKLGGCLLFLAVLIF